MSYFIFLPDPMGSKRSFLLGSTLVVSLVCIAPVFADSIPDNIDIQAVKDTRMQWHNQERVSEGLAPYTGNSLLDTSSQTWAEYLKKLGTTTHRRTKKDGYYNYRSIKNWFDDQGISFTGTNTSNLFSESLGRGYFSCRQADCTTSLISALKRTFAFFMSEKYSSWRPHYNGIVMKDFANIGLGLAINKNKFYVVTQYGQQVIPTGDSL